MSAIAAVQWTAIATIGLAVFAVFGTVFAYLAFRSQALDLRTRQLQMERQQELIQIQSQQLRASLDNLQRVEADRRAAQARRVVVSEYLQPDKWISATEGTGDAVNIEVRNTSDLPIRDVVISWHKGTAPWGNPDHDQGFVLVPGTAVNWDRFLPDDLPATVDKNLFGATVYFRDSNQVYWHAWPNGDLQEVAPGQEPRITDDNA